MLMDLIDVPWVSCEKSYDGTPSTPGVQSLNIPFSLEDNHPAPVTAAPAQSAPPPKKSNLGNYSKLTKSLSERYQSMAKDPQSWQANQTDHWAIKASNLFKPQNQ